MQIKCLICNRPSQKLKFIQLTVTYASEGDIHRLRIWSLTKTHTMGYNIQDIFIYDNELI